MSLFKKNKKVSALSALLYDNYKRAFENGEKNFYYALFDNEKTFAEEFCRKNKINMELDHVTDGNLIYKFTISN